MPAINQEYKDRLFSFLFGNKGNREWTLSLYNYELLRRCLSNLKYSGDESKKDILSEFFALRTLYEAL